MTGTLGREVISTRQRKIAELAQREPKLTLTTLAHHIDAVWMREAYRRIRKDAAAGVDGVTAAQYEADLNITASGNDVVIDLSSQGGGYIHIENIAVDDLDATAFCFYEAPPDSVDM